MKKIMNTPETFVYDMCHGLAAAHPELEFVEKFKVVKKKEINRNKVTLISGGGSGHEPAHAGFVANVGEIVGNIYGRVYLGNASRLDIKDVTYGEGASKYLISNGTLHVFNGLEKRLPMYDENTYIKSTEVAQTIK